jgi:hypothetical protein
MVVVGVDEVDGVLSGIPLSSAYAFSADDKKGGRRNSLVIEERHIRGTF